MARFSDHRVTVIKGDPIPEDLVATPRFIAGDDPPRPVSNRASRRGAQRRHNRLRNKIEQLKKLAKDER